MPIGAQRLAKVLLGLFVFSGSAVLTVILLLAALEERYRASDRAVAGAFCGLFVIFALVGLDVIARGVWPSFERVSPLRRLTERFNWDWILRLLLLGSRGSFRVARHQSGFEVRIHWAILLGLPLATGLRWAPRGWLGYVLVILLHEIGHAVAVRRVGARVEAIWLGPLGGMCSWRGNVTAVQRAIIAWGGVLAQVVLLATVLIGGLVFPVEGGAASEDLYFIFTVVNAIIIVINLLPFAPLDGHEAWQLFGFVRRAELDSSARLRAVREAERDLKRIFRAVGKDD